LIGLTTESLTWLILLAFVAFAAPTLFVCLMQRRNSRRAEHQLAGVRARDLDTLIALATPEVDRCRRRRRAHRAVEIVCRYVLPAAPLAGLLLSRAVKVDWLAPQALLGWAVAQCILSMAVLTPLTLLSYETDLHRRALGLLARSNDLRVAGPLIEALASRDRDVRRMAGDRLTRVLPRMRHASPSQLDLSPDQLRLLHRELAGSARGASHTLILAILKALERVGSESTLPVLQRLELACAGRSEKRIATAAARCRSRLEARIESERSTRTLLRPLEASERVLLVRPTDASAARPDQLLRTV
jgi:hypothetical protein